TDALDPITTEIIARHVIATAEEMGVVLMRTAFSPNIKERHDCSTAIFDAKGNVVAQAEHVPIHLGSMIGAIDSIRARFPQQEIRPGDMFVANDPYNGGGSHLPDLNVIAPVFHDGRIVAYVANIAHHADVGGMVPGSEAAVCESIFQEGLRLPPVRLMRQGEVAQDMFEVILLNSRTPEERKGDLNAQLAANRVGIRAIESLIARYGADTFEQALDSYLDFTERRFQAAVSDLPDGDYFSEDFLGGDEEGTLARLACTLTVRGGELTFDFTGTDPQLRFARNIPNQALVATVYCVAKAILDPDAPANGGAFRIINITAPKGSIVQPVPPAPVGTRSISCSVLSDVVLTVLSQAIPGRGFAGSGPHALMVLSGTDPRTGKYFVDYETVAGALGAQTTCDGLDAVRTLTSGSANLPVEALEHAYPLRVETYALRTGAGGKGQYRGGDGIVRDFRALGDDITVSVSGERQHAAAPGAAGGSDGALGTFILDPGGPNERKLSAAVGREPLPRGAIIRVTTPGGGGWGDPAKRDPALIEKDIREDRVRQEGS
ncbi:MAG: hydantoinase B/oxoprolinase family protein, partial [Proteobacteria bacterium]|nr:hydantoinase B/oxoprolinase family protein [Pseudomonadota bacterium]